jgi:tetratricopeptide (TPR) repeat protein
MKSNMMGVLLTCALSATCASAATDLMFDLVDKGHYKRAEVLLRSQLERNTEDPLANCLMSKVDVGFGRYDEAISHAEKAVAADGNSGKYHAQLADALVSKLSSSSAGIFQKLSVARRFKKESDIALKLDPKNEDANQDLLEFDLEAPGIAGGGKDKARELADRVTKIDAKLGYYLQAQIAQHEKHSEEAVRFLKQILQTDPNHYNANVEVANLFLNQTPPNFVQAEEQARQALKIDPQRAAAYGVLAVLAARQAHWKDLDQFLSDSEKNVPDDFNPFYQAGKSLLLAGDASQLLRAESYFRRYLEQQPEAGTPNLAAAHWRLGLVLEKEGRKEDARAELQTAITLDPNLKEAQQDLKRLK